MNRNIVVKYLEEKGIVSVPEVQVKFNVGYKEVRELFSELEEDGRLVAKDELSYAYKANVRIKKNATRKDSVSEPPELAQYRAELERRKQEIFKRLEQACNEEEDCDEEDEEDEYEVGDYNECDDIEENTEEAILAARAHLEQRKQEILKRLTELTKEDEFKTKWKEKIEVGLSFWRNEISVDEALKKDIQFGELGVIVLIKDNRRSGLKGVLKKAQSRFFEYPKDINYYNMWMEAIKLLQEMSDEEFNSIKAMIFG